MSSDTTHPLRREIRTRQRASTSCTECRRRKQKCNQAKDRPCNNCARRYPPVPCTYEAFRKSSKYKESVIELNVTSLKSEDAVAEEDSVGFEELSPHHHSSSSNLVVSQVRPPSSRLASRLSSNSSWHHSKFQALWDTELVIREQDEALSEEGNSTPDLSPSFRGRQFHPHPEEFQRNSFKVPKAYVGDGAVDSFRFLPMEPSRRNSEFLQFFVQRLAPYMSSIDGLNPPPHFHQRWVSFMLQSPILGYIAILTTSYFYAACQGIDVDKSVDVVMARVKLIHLINDHIVNHKGGCNDEAIATVNSLAYNELIYADERSTLAHMRGLADMVRTRGGLYQIEFTHLRKMLMRTDYQVALTFEVDLFMQDDERIIPLPVLDMYPLELDNPMVQSPTRFIDSAKILGLGVETATLLDDMRHLTTIVLNLRSEETPNDGNSSFLTTLENIQHRLANILPTKHPILSNDFVYQTCHTAALIYLTALRSRTPLSQSCTPSYLQSLWSTMWRVPLPHWKTIPGIFLWILLIVNPFAKDKPEARFLKGLTPATTMAIGLVDWDVIVATMRGCLKVQRWLRGEEVVFEPSDVIPRSIAPESGVPAWAMSRSPESEVEGWEEE